MTPGLIRSEDVWVAVLRALLSYNHRDNIWIMSEFAVELVKKFWELMASNDFQSVGSILSDDFVLEWPQSGERIRGRDNYAAMNEEYPAHGRWTFTINRLVGNDHEAVSDVTVSDGLQVARALSFFETRDGKIIRMVEYWPEPFAARHERKHLVEVSYSQS